MGERKRLIRKSRGQLWTNLFLIGGAIATITIAVFEGVKFVQRNKVPAATIQGDIQTHSTDTLTVRVLQIQKDTQQIAPPKVDPKQVVPKKKKK